MTPPATDRALSLDDRMLIARVRKYLELHPPEEPSWWVYETLGLIYGRLERRWVNGQWQTVDASTGKPMKPDSVIQWWTSRTAPASRMDE